MKIMNVSIQPLAAGSKILVCVNMCNCYTNGNTTEVQFIVYRNSTEITGLARYFGAGGTTPVDGSPNGMFLDTPTYTLGNSITYRLKVARVAGSDGYVINHTNGQSKSSITVMEIAAMNYNKIDALFSLKPNKDFIWRVDRLFWFGMVRQFYKPTESELDAEVTRLTNAEPLRLLRIERNTRLTLCDWTQSRDLTLSNDADWKTTDKH